MLAWWRTAPALPLIHMKNCWFSSRALLWGSYMIPSNTDVDLLGSIRDAHLFPVHFKQWVLNQTLPFERDQRLQLNSIPPPL